MSEEENKYKQPANVADDFAEIARRLKEIEKETKDSLDRKKSE